MSITRDEAIAIARADAKGAYENASKFAVSATFDGENWHVEFELDAEPPGPGGAPEYVVAGEDGEILDATYRQ